MIDKEPKTNNKVSYSTIYMIESDWETLKQKTGCITKVDALKYAIQQIIGVK